MAVLTADQTAYFKRKLGTSVNLVDIAARIDRLMADGAYAGTTDDIDVVVEVIEERISTMSATPLTFAVPGEYSQSTVGNMKLLQRQLADALAEQASGEEVDGGFVFVQHAFNVPPERQALDTEEFVLRRRTADRFLGR